MHTGTCRFTNYIQALQRCSAIQRCFHSATNVVSSRSNWNQLSAWVNSSIKARGRDGRKSLFKLFDVASIQIHMVINACRCLGHTFTDGGRNNVARCKIFLRMHALHHALPRCIEKNATFSTHSFTDQCLLTRCFTSTPQNCWVKLNKFKITCF